MFNQHKRIVTCIALLLCVITLTTTAFAYTEQAATHGYVRPITYHAGNGSDNPLSTYCDPVIVGYRFTVWRSTDRKTDPGYKLGHSINIICNTVYANGNARMDYANGYGQDGLYMPHMLTNGEQTDFIDKITLAQNETRTDDVWGDSKFTHTTATGLMLMDYSGADTGYLNDVSESSYFEFTAPIYRDIDARTDKGNNIILNNKLRGISNDNSVTIYSGYHAFDKEADGLLNQSAANSGEAGNLYTYVYGFQYSSQMSTDPNCSGKDMSDFLTISDVDYEGDVLPFNQNPANVIDANNERSWTNRNAPLIATLCGLTPQYGKAASTLSDEEFGVFDYITPMASATELIFL